MKSLKKLMTVMIGYIALLSIGFLVTYVPLLLILSRFVNNLFIFILSLLVSIIFTLMTSTVEINPDY